MRFHFATRWSGGNHENLSVVIVNPAQKQWRSYCNRIRCYCGQQPADNTQADFRATVVDLTRTAGSRPLYYEEPIAADMGYHRINFVEGHHYFILYRLVGGEAVIEYVAHFRRSVKKMMGEAESRDQVP